MQILVKEVRHPFWDDDDVNVIVNGNCKHVLAEADEIEPGVLPDRPTSTRRDAIYVCTNCTAWRYPEDDEWHNEVMVDPLYFVRRTTGKLVPR